MTVAETGRVSIKIEDLRRLIDHLRQAFITLWGDNTVSRNLGALELPSDSPGVLVRAAWWANDQVPMLERRLTLAEAVDVDDGASDGGVVVLDGALLAYATGYQAESAGADLARRMTADDDYQPTDAELAELALHQLDPNFVTGFYDELGPGGLAWLTAAVQPDDPVLSRGDDPGEALPVVGASFGLYTRVNPAALDEGWLGRYNRLDQSEHSLVPHAATRSFAALLLGTLLPYGRYGPEFLTRLGDLTFGPDGAERSFNVVADLPPPGAPEIERPGESGLGPFIYQAVLLEAMARDPAHAGEFADRYLGRLLEDSRDSARYYGRGDGTLPRDEVGDRLEDARIDLIRVGALPQNGAAGNPAVVANAENLVAHLAFLEFRNQGGGDEVGHVSSAMQLLYGDVLHQYADGMYRSATSPLPGTSGLFDENGNPASEWPSSPPGLQIPHQMWRAMLVEALREPENLPRLLADAEAAAAAAAPSDIAGASTNGTENTNVKNFRYFQMDLVNYFFLGAVGETARGLGGDVDELVGATNEVLTALVGVGAATVAGGPAGALDAIIATTVDQATGHALERIGTTLDPVTREYVETLDDAVGEPTWQITWERGVRRMWNRRGDTLNPIEETTVVTDPGGVGGDDGISRDYSGDPVRDGYITARGAEDDFLLESGDIMDLAAMSPAQRAAYERWLYSPAVIANNHDGERLIVSGYAASQSMRSGS